MSHFYNKFHCLETLPCDIQNCHPANLAITLLEMNMRYNNRRWSDLCEKNTSEIVKMWMWNKKTHYIFKTKCQASERYKTVQALLFAQKVKSVTWKRDRWKTNWCLCFAMLYKANHNQTFLWWLICAISFLLLRKNDNLLLFPFVFFSDREITTKLHEITK